MVFMQMFLSLVNDIQSIKIIHVNSLIKYREFMKDCEILVAQCTLLKGVLQTFDSFTKFAGNLHTFHIIYQVLISAVLNNHTNPVINNLHIEMVQYRNKKCSVSSFRYVKLMFSFIRFWMVSLNAIFERKGTNTVVSHSVVLYLKMFIAIPFCTIFHFNHHS